MDIKSVLALLAFLSTGCTASFEPRFSSLDVAGGGLPSAREVRAGLEISIEEFASPDKSRRSFDADLAQHEVLALLVRVENKGVQTYKIQRNQIRAVLSGEPLTSLYAYEAAKRGARRDPTWNALVNTAATGYLGIVLGLPVMIASVQHTKSVNQKIEHHFESLEFRDALVKPDEKATGFVFFKLPEKIRTLENLTVEVTIETDGYHDENGRATYRLLLPTLSF